MTEYIDDDYRPQNPRVHLAVPTRIDPPAPTSESPKLPLMLGNLRRLPSHERRAKANKLDGWALGLERAADLEPDVPDTLREVARQLREIAEVIRPG